VEIYSLYFTFNLYCWNIRTNCLLVFLFLFLGIPNSKDYWSTRAVVSKRQLISSFLITITNIVLQKKPMNNTFQIKRNPIQLLDSSTDIWNISLSMELLEPSNSNTEKELSRLLKILNRDLQINKRKSLENVMALEQWSLRDLTYLFCLADKYLDLSTCLLSSVWHFGIMKNTFIMQVLF